MLNGRHADRPEFNDAMAYLPPENLPQTLFWVTGAVAFSVSIINTLLTWKKDKLDRTAQEWERANQAYEKFIDVAINNPEFVPGYWSDSVLPGHRNKYRWFMARFLWAAEQALLRVPEKREEWERAVKVMLREHSDFITSTEARDETDCYYGPLKRLIEEVRDEARAAAPS